MRALGPLKQHLRGFRDMLRSFSLPQLSLSPLSPHLPPPIPQDDVVLARQGIISIMAGMLVRGRTYTRGLSERSGHPSPQPSPLLSPFTPPRRHLSLTPPLLLLQFGAGWWCFIDGFGVGVTLVGDQEAKDASGYAWLPLFSATLAYLM